MGTRSSQRGAVAVLEVAAACWEGSGKVQGRSWRWLLPAGRGRRWAGWVLGGVCVLAGESQDRVLTCSRTRRVPRACGACGRAGGRAGGRRRCVVGRSAPADRGPLREGGREGGGGVSWAVAPVDGGR